MKRKEVEQVKTASWHDINWQTVTSQVKTTQDKIARAEIEKNPKEVYRLQRGLVTSFAGRAYAVRKIVTNDGGKTPGVDKVIWDDAKTKFEAIKELGRWTKNPKEYRAQPLHRICHQQKTQESREEAKLDTSTKPEVV
jgi:RNA-directed DNA polymerase